MEGALSALRYTNVMCVFKLSIYYPGMQGSIAWPDTLHLAGDIHDLAVQRVSGNITALLEQKKTRRET